MVQVKKMDGTADPHIKYKSFIFKVSLVLYTVFQVHVDVSNTIPLDFSELQFFQQSNAGESENIRNGTITHIMKCLR